MIETLMASNDRPFPPTAVVFDFDGLLADTESIEFNAWRAVYRSSGHELTETTWLQAVGYASHFDPVKELNGRLGMEADWKRLHALRTRIRDEMLESLSPLEGATELLEHFRALQIPMACASNSGRAWVESGLSRIGLSGLFSALVSREDVQNPKPAPDPYLLAIQRLGVEKRDRCLAFEDSEPGVRSAVSAGLWTVVIPNPLTIGQNLSLANETFASLEVFLHALKN